MNRTRKIIVGVFSALLVLVAIIGITYAYFVARVQGNTSAVSITTKAGILSLVYAEGQNDVIEATNILPGYTNTKNFTVTNNGTGTASYGVFLEELRNTFSRKEDLKITLTCTSNVESKECNGLTQSNFPTQNDLLITNEIEKDEVQTYTLTFEYLNVDTNQNADNNASLFTRVQIYDLQSTVDLEGTVENSQPGDYVVVNSSPKRSEIVNGTFKVVGLEPDNHTINVYNESNIITPKSTSSLSIVSGTEESISGSTVTIVESSRTITTSVNATSSNSITVGDIEQISNGGGNNNTGIDTPGTLAYTIINNARNVTNEQKALLYAEYSEIPKTTPALQVSGESESTLSKAEDENNTYSYYFRGIVSNNYVNFSGKCWRIVRIEGDGSVKLILEDKNTTCDSELYTGNWSVDAGYYGYIIGIVSNTNGDKTSDRKTIADFSNNEALSYLSDVGNGEYGAYTKITNWINDANNGIVKSKIKTNETWCLGNTTDVYNSSGTKLSEPKQDLMYNSATFYYETNKRLNGNEETANATYRCNSSNDKTYTGYVGLITADEAVFAGTKANIYTNHNFYLINDWQKTNNKHFWTLSPGMFYKYTDSAFRVVYNGWLNSGSINSTYDFRPVISLQSGTEIKIGGDGSQSNPYVIK